MKNRIKNIKPKHRQLLRWFSIIPVVIFVMSFTFHFANAATPLDVTTFGTSDVYPANNVNAGGVNGYLVSDIVNSGWDFRVYASDNTADVAVCVEVSTGETHLAYGATNTGATTLNAISLASNDGQIFDLKSVDITIDGINGGATSGNVRLIGYHNGSPVAGAVLEQSVHIASDSGTLVNFDVAADADFVGIDMFRIQSDGAFTISGAIGVDNINAINFRTSVQNAHTGASSANTLFPVVGVEDAITLTVKDSLGNTDTNFDGAKNVERDHHRRGSST